MPDNSLSKDFSSTIFLIGSGNVAFHLAPALKDAGFNIEKVMSQNPTTGNELAEKLNAGFSTNITNDSEFNGLVLICLKDSSISGFAESHYYPKAVVAHTSGSLPIEVLQTCSPNSGVIYPFQTFTRSGQISLSEVPFLVEASNKATGLFLEKLARKISSFVIQAKPEQRANLHLAGVWGSFISVGGDAGVAGGEGTAATGGLKGMDKFVA